MKISSLLNTRFWLLLFGSFFSLFATWGMLSGSIADSAPTFWSKSLSGFEIDMAVVNELTWAASSIVSGITAIAVALFASGAVRARIGAVVALSSGFVFPFLASDAGAAYGYGGLESGLPPEAIFYLAVPILTLIACVSKWNEGVPKKKGAGGRNK